MSVGNSADSFRPLARGFFFLRMQLALMQFAESCFRPLIRGFFFYSGEVEQTNEEWLKQANTEQLARVIHLMTTCCYVCGKDGVDYKRCYFHKKCAGPKEIEEWLKEIHQ